MGGIAKYTQKAGSKIRLAQESAQALSARMTNLLAKMSTLSDEAIQAEISRFAVLLEQFEMGLQQAFSEGEIDQTQLTQGLNTHALASASNGSELASSNDALIAWLTE